jgi:glycosyltransferase involved in cell wall biosynthesis
MPSVLFSHPHKATDKISVIICARNEENNIKACLDSVLKQTFVEKPYQVIVVDDFSTDDTAAIVRSYTGSNVTLLSLKDYIDSPLNSYKKKALEVGIENATGDIIVTTDADCIVPPTWLQYLTSFFGDGGDYRRDPIVFVAAPVAYSNNNNFLQLFQSLDFMTLQGITGAAVFRKRLSMCNGANLAYSKKAFYAVNGFTGIDNIASGDDMLLMHKIYKKYPNGILFLKAQGVIVQTSPMTTLKDFFNQRIRWASKADQYDDKRIFTVLLIVYLFNLLLLVMPVMALFSNRPFGIHIYPVTLTATIFEWWLFLLLGKTLIELYFLFPVAKFFKSRKLLWWFPLMQPFHILYTLIAGWLGKFGSYRWKGRNVK